MYGSICLYFLDSAMIGEYRRVMTKVEQDQTIGTGMGEKKNLKGQNGKAELVLETLRIPTQVKLAGLWGAVMFMYIYVDIIGFFKPGTIADILVGKAWIYEIDQTWLLLSLMLMTLPVIMVCVSLMIPAKMNRFANIGLGAFHIVIAFGFASGEINAYYVFGTVVEVIILAMIIWTAWKWPMVVRNGAAGN
jgi:hypothetical protein